MYVCMYVCVSSQGMRLAKHVFLKRNDIKSTIEVADTCIDRVSWVG